jgi:hypothetical protein
MPDLANLSVRKAVDIDPRERAGFVGRSNAIEGTLLGCLHRPAHHDGPARRHQVVDGKVRIWED